MATPLVIDADLSDVRVRHSGLELKNRSLTDQAMAHNHQLRADRRKASNEALRQEAAVGAEFIHRRSTSTKAVKLKDVEDHYQLSEDKP